MRPLAAYDDRGDSSTPAGRIFSRLSSLMRVRRVTPEFAGNALFIFRTPAREVLGYVRPGRSRSQVLVLANVGDHPVSIEAITLSGMDDIAEDLVTDERLDLGNGLELAPHGFVWLRVLPNDPL